MIISWNTTKKCNLFCEHCYRDSGPNVKSEDELNTDEGKLLIEQINAAGFKILILSGGEPLLREDIFELADHARKVGLRPVLGTNGTLLTVNIADKLVKSGVTGVAISIDSISKGYHDRFRKFEGAWDKAVEGIKNSVHKNIRVQVNMTITENNFGQFDEVVDFVMSLGVQAVHPFFLIPAGRGKNIEEESLKRENYFNMIEMILNKQKEISIELKPTCAPQFMPIAKEMGLNLRFTRGCIAGITYCCVLPNGDVHVCPYLPVKAGSVREKSFYEIWKQSEIFNKLRNPHEYEGVCGKCTNINICGGCRARAYYYNNGNFMSEDPWCKTRTVKVDEEKEYVC